MDPAKFDEVKVVLGCRNRQEAKELYLSNYREGWKCGPITAMSLSEFKWWLKNGDMYEPCCNQGTPKFAEDAYSKWVGFDLDGTLAKSEKNFDPDSVGEPVPSVLEFAKGLIKNGDKIKIFTARAAEAKNIPVVKEWAKKHGLGDVDVTNEKDPGMILLVDDRAIQAVKNKGLSAEDVREAKAVVKGASVVRLENDQWKIYDQNNQDIEDGFQAKTAVEKGLQAVDLLDRTGLGAHYSRLVAADMDARKTSAAGLLKPVAPTVDLHVPDSADIDIGDLTAKVAADMRGLQPLRQLSDDEKSELVKYQLERAAIDPEISERTLGAPIGNLGRDAFLATSAKLLAINRGEAKPDDRDHKANQTYHSVEDFLSERVAKDADGIGRTLLMRVRYNGTLDPLRPGLFTKQLEKLIVSNSLSQAVPGINPVELVDIQQKVTQVGEGGIGSRDAVPMEARNVHPSQLGVVDPIRTAESGAVGIDQRLSSFARKGPNQQLYMPLIDRKTGKRVWRTPSQLYGKTILFPRPTSIP